MVPPCVTREGAFLPKDVEVWPTRALRLARGQRPRGDRGRKAIWGNPRLPGMDRHRLVNLGALLSGASTCCGGSSNHGNGLSEPGIGPGQRGRGPRQPHRSALGVT